MSAHNIGFVSSIASFARESSRVERDAAMSPVGVPDRIDDLRDEVGDRFASLCGLALRRVMAQARSPLKTVRVENGYGYVEHHKDWLRLGCDFMVEEEELAEAMLLMSEPTIAGLIDSRVETATQEFLDGHFRSGLFADVSCAFYLLEEPQKA